MNKFKNKDIPDIGNPFDCQSLCDTSQEKSHVYIDWLEDSHSTGEFEGHKGCYEMSCGNCILNDKQEFKTWKAHLRMTGEENA